MSPTYNGSQTSQVVQRKGQDLFESDVTVDIEEIDLQALAEEVYALLTEKVWLERERRGWHRFC